MELLPYKNSKIDISEFNPEENFVYAKFQIGDKMIAIELGELRSDVRFYYHIYIDNSKFPKKKHVMTEKEKREEQKQKEETEKIRNNSF
ncbi:hypothetical protein NXX54_13480 [Bacteroides sp. BFG-638]|uniref:hypothetical protein n=1 Tax=Bacteroides sp. BFG-638 TaxID=2972765 RepID=UPI0021655D8E|nr:hypothetical protein [Bacteroides sp. BFG-638]MCS2949327.1 hypothetical protein [Bacteroides sp. BFG-638]